MSNNMDKDKINSIVARIKSVYDLIEALMELNNSICSPSLRQTIADFILADLLVLQEITLFLDKYKEESDLLLESIRSFIENNKDMSENNDAARYQLQNQVRDYIHNLIECEDTISPNVRPTKIEGFELDNMLNDYLGLIMKVEEKSEGDKYANRQEIDVYIALNFGDKNNRERNTSHYEQFDNDCDPNEIPNCDRNGHVVEQENIDEEPQEVQALLEAAAAADVEASDDEESDTDDDGDGDEEPELPEEEMPPAPQNPVNLQRVVVIPDHINDFDNALMQEIQNLMNEMQNELNQDLEENNPNND